MIDADSPHQMIDLYSGQRKGLKTKLRLYDQSTFDSCDKALRAAKAKKVWDGKTSNQKSARRKQKAEQLKLKRLSRNSNELSNDLERDRSRKKQNSNEFTNDLEKD